MNDDVYNVLTDLIALERDRELGYPSDELHAYPRDVLGNALDVLEDHGEDPEHVIFPDDQELLGIDRD